MNKLISSHSKLLSKVRRLNLQSYSVIFVLHNRKYLKTSKMFSFKFYFLFHTYFNFNMLFFYSLFFLCLATSNCFGVEYFQFNISLHRSYTTNRFTRCVLCSYGLYFMPVLLILTKNCLSDIILLKLIFDCMDPSESK